MRHLRSVLAAGCAIGLMLTAAACGGDEAGGGGGDKPIVGLITKTDTNPFFVKMKEGAQQAADSAGVELQSFAGKQDGDNEAQVQAIESLISAGAKGFLITPSYSKTIVPAIDKAKQQGLLVIALDTPTDPANAVDATFAPRFFSAANLSLVPCPGHRHRGAGAGADPDHLHRGHTPPTTTRTMEKPGSSGRAIPHARAANTAPAHRETTPHRLMKDGG